MSSVIIGVIAWWLSEGNGLIQQLKDWLNWTYKDKYGIHRQYRLKPIDCALCLGFWIGLIYNFSSDAIHTLTMAILSSFFAILTSKVMNRI